MTYATPSLLPRALFGGALLLSTAGASAQVAPGPPTPPGERVRLLYDAPFGCPSEAQFFSQIRARTSHVELAATGEDARVLMVSLHASSQDPRSDGVSTWGELAFEDQGLRSATRRVPGATCDEVVSALALIAALALDPSASTVAPAPSPDPPPQPPAPKPADPPPRPLSAVQARLGAAIVSAIGVAPGLTVGPAAFVEVSTRGPWAVSARLVGEHTFPYAVATPIGTADLSWTSGWLALCPARLFPGLAWELSLCATGELGVLAGSGAPGHSGASVLGRLGFMPLLRWSLLSWLAVELEGGVAFPLKRDHFIDEPDSPIYTMPSVGGRFGGGLVARVF